LERLLGGLSDYAIAHSLADRNGDEQDRSAGKQQNGRQSRRRAHKLALLYPSE
jgi:hypothetical protein